MAASSRGDSSRSPPRASPRRACRQRSPGCSHPRALSSSTERVRRAPPRRERRRWPAVARLGEGRRRGRCGAARWRPSLSRGTTRRSARRRCSVDAATFPSPGVGSDRSMSGMSSASGTVDAGSSSGDGRSPPIEGSSSSFGRRGGRRADGDARARLDEGKLRQRRSSPAPARHREVDRFRDGRSAGASGAGAPAARVRRASRSARSTMRGPSAPEAPASTKASSASSGCSGSLVLELAGARRSSSNAGRSRRLEHPASAPACSEARGFGFERLDRLGGRRRISKPPVFTSRPCGRFAMMSCRGARSSRSRKTSFARPRAACSVRAARCIDRFAIDRARLEPRPAVYRS